MALEEFGRDRTLEHVGVEPSGDAFNSIELEPRTMRPYNAMINAGAIAIASMIKKDSRESGVRTFVEKMAGAAGRPLRIDELVYASEDATGNRNRAMAYLMLNCGIIDAEVDHSADRDVHLRAVRSRPRRGLPGGPSSQERRGWRHHYGGESLAGHRCIFAAVGCQGQQCPWHIGVQGTRQPPRLTRIPNLRMWTRTSCSGRVARRLCADSA